MSKIDIQQYKNIFESLYKNELLDRVKPLEKMKAEDNINTISLSLSKDEFFVPTKKVILNNESGVLLGKVMESFLKHIYISYRIFNNSFNEPPDESFLNLEESKEWKITIDIVTSDNLKVIPYIVHYKDGKKRKLTKIVLTRQLLNFKNDEKCRLTFKIVGTGSFQINRIGILPVTENSKV